MNAVNSVFKRLRLERVLIVFFAGILLFFSTACQSGSVEAANPEAGQGGKMQYSEQNTRKDSETERRVTPYPDQGASETMNNFPDTDARRDTSSAETKAKALIDQSKRNLSKVDSGEELVNEYRKGPEFVGNQVKSAAERARSNAKNLAEDATQGTQRGVRNLKENAQDAKANAQNAADNAL